TRAMWEARDKGHEAMWGVMMSYFSWIVPSGSEMQSQVLGIPVADLGEESLNVEARKNWLKAWTAEMKRLAMGETLLRDTDDLLESSPEVAEEKPAWQRYLEEEGKTGQDALDYIAGDGVDF